MSIFAIVLRIHIGLAIALFVPSLLLPFTLRTNRARARRAGQQPDGRRPQLW